MASNQEIIRKTDLTVTNLTDDGGLLNPEQANRFVRKLIKSPTILRDARTVEMSSPQRNINKIQFNKRILRAATSATALITEAADEDVAFDPTDAGEGLRRAKVKTEQIQLNTSEVIAQIDLSYDVIEDNVERGNIGQHREGGNPAAGGGLIDTILQLMAERAALDFEEMALLGDTTLGAADPYLALQDGWIKLIEDNGNVADQGGAAISKAVFKDGKKTMPDQYLKNIASLRQYVSMDQETEYRDTVASRGTALGDATLTGNNPLFVFGSPVSPVQQMPEDKGIFSNPLNLIWGIQRKVTLESDKDITARVFQIVVTARVALQVEETEAAVVYNNIAAA